MLNATQKYNRILSKNVIEKAIEETMEEWWVKEIKQSNQEFIDWLMKGKV